MNKLDKLLLGENTVFKQANTYGFNELPITDYALQKAQTYARLMNEISGIPSMECGGYLIAPKESGSLIATDAFLVPGQNVKDGLYQVHPVHVRNAGRILEERGQRILGWWHSHGSMRTFFSELDNIGQMTILNEIAPSNKVTRYQERELEAEIEVLDDRVVVKDKKGRINYSLHGNPDEIQKLTVMEEVNVGFAYALVVNNPFDKELTTYSEIGVRRYCETCNNGKDRSFEVPLKIFETGDFEIDEKLLVDHIYERVRWKTFWQRSRIYRGVEVLSSESDEDDSPEDREKENFKKKLDRKKEKEEKKNKTTRKGFFQRFTSMFEVKDIRFQNEEEEDAD